MNVADKTLLKNISDILTHGDFDEAPRPRYASDGEPAFTKFITHVFDTYDLSEGEFPIPTLMPTAIKSGFKEILWIYKDQTSDLSVLRKKYDVHWWDEWDIGDGTIGKRYGEVIAEYSLLHKLLNGLEKDPFGRRHIINMYQEADMKETSGLHPCAYETVWSVRKRPGGGYFLDQALIQRSNDFLVAGFINKAQYVSLQLMVAGHLRTRGMDIEVGKFSHFVNNLHIYDRHLKEAERILTLEAKDVQPRLMLTQDRHFFDYTVDDLIIIDYDAHPRSGKLDLGV